MNFYTVAIFGAGHLGSRYLQGLSTCSIPLKIYVQDISQSALLKAENYWHEVEGSSTVHEISFISDIRNCPALIDLAIVATTADVRPEVVKKISHLISVRYWILEKVIAQSIKGLEEIQSYIGNRSLAWVNTPRRIVPWYQSIKEELNSPLPYHLSVTGGQWGLACNAVHFLDLLSWWSGEILAEVRTDQLDENWFLAKRVGNWEICGTLKGIFSNGSTASLSTSRNGQSVYLIELTNSKGKWCIDEKNGIAQNTNGLKILGKLPYQSEMTASLVESILVRGDCDLPTLRVSIDIHIVFINEMLEHWRRHQDEGATFVPIT
jgi:hypothetical protein